MTRLQLTAAGDFGALRVVPPRWAWCWVLLFTLSACVSSTGHQAAVKLELSACTVQQVNARCGTLSVPEDRHIEGGRKIDLRVKAATTWEQ